MVLVPAESCSTSVFVTLVNNASTMEVVAAEKIRVSVLAPPSIESPLPNVEGAMLILSLPERLVKLMVALIPEASKVSAEVVPAALTVPVPLIV